MGATASVHVEQLVMAGTVEQTLYELHVARHGESSGGRRGDESGGGESGGGDSGDPSCGERVSGGDAGESGAFARADSSHAHPDGDGTDGLAPSTPPSNASGKRPRGASWGARGPPGVAHPATPSAAPAASNDGAEMPSSHGGQQARRGPARSATAAATAHDAATLRALLSSMRFIR